ncbi:putative capsular polysaccharide synthesis family protein [Marinobacterium aestuariivivens]|uniref:Capsular polysaccharide synthesis family protein n=1 Tax=Marinobacterium aestuariivivens TaxID=1698799 RepID=A0ABW1ZZI1_9GAMM
MLTRLKSVWDTYSNPDNIIIYQMGKVGSSSLEKSIPNSIHTHMMYGNSPCHVHLDQRRRGLKKAVGFIGDSIKRAAVMQRDEIKIITPIREPAARNVSMFFQDLAHWIYHYCDLGNHDNRFDDSRFLEKVFQDAFDHKYALDWFDTEFRRFTGVDIYATPYNKEQGYMEIRQGKFHILIIDSKRIKENISIIETFSGRKIDIQDSNIADNKWYGLLYKEFKKNFDMERYKNSLQSHRFYEKFYT